MCGYGTSYLETELILAASQDDTETVERLMTRMLPGELTALGQACEVLLEAVERHPVRDVDSVDRSRKESR